MINQPSPLPPVSYTPTRQLKADALQQLKRIGLPPIELLTEQAVRDFSVAKLRNYVTLYGAKIATLRAPRVRKDMDPFFKLWFRHLYDIDEVSHHKALPVYLPVPGTGNLRPTFAATGPNSFCASTGVGCTKLRPLCGWMQSPNKDAESAYREAADENLLRVEESVIELLRVYGLHGGSWETLGDEGILTALDYLCSKNKALKEKDIATEEVAHFLDTLVEIAARQLESVDTEKHSHVLGVPASVSLFRNGVCALLIRYDYPGICTV